MRMLTVSVMAPPVAPLTWSPVIASPTITNRMNSRITWMSRSMASASRRLGKRAHGTSRTTASPVTTSANAVPAPSCTGHIPITPAPRLMRDGACRRVQQRARHRRGGGRGAGRAPRRAGDLVHRRDRDRADDHGVGGATAERPVDGARRQVAVHYLRGRRSGSGGGQRAVRRLLAERRALHGGLENTGRTYRV